MNRIAIAILMLSLSCTGATWYVDKDATGANNGTSWANAWTNPASIVWGGGSVQAGDTIRISGGSTSKTYTNQLSVGANSVTITPGTDAGHDGTVIFDGLAVAIRLYGYTNLVIDGLSGDALAGDFDYGLVITNCLSTGSGIYDSSGGGGTIRRVRITGSQTTGSNDLLGGIYVSGSPSFMEIDRCWIGGNYDATPANLWHGSGIVLFNTSAFSSVSETNRIVRRSLVENLYHDGIKVGDCATVSSNEVRVVNGSGHSDSIICQSGSNVRIEANYVHSGTDQCIYLDNLSTTVQQTNVWIFNNLLDRQLGLGIVIDVGDVVTGQGWSNVRVYHNTHKCTAGAFLGTTLRANGGTIIGLDVRNNLIGTNTVGNQITLSTNCVGPFLDYNAYDSGSSAYPTLAGIGGTGYNLSGLQGIGLETNGRTGTPSWNGFRLLPSDTLALKNGTNLTDYVPVDVYGTARTPPVDIGAFELNGSYIRANSGRIGTVRSP